MKGSKSMSMKSDSYCSCVGGMCHKCRGSKLIIAGIVFLANYYWLNWDWWMLVGWLLLVAGLAKIVKPYCGHCCN